MCIVYFNLYIMQRFKNFFVTVSYSKAVLWEFIHSGKLKFGSESLNFIWYIGQSSISGTTLIYLRPMFEGASLLE